MNQEPINLLEFQKKFATEKKCYKHLEKMRWSNGFVCPHCEHKKAYYLEKRKLYQCCKCKYQTSLTSGTIFHNSRTPLIKWFWMIFVIARHKSVAVLSLQKMLDITYNKENKEKVPDTKDTKGNLPKIGS